MKYFKYSFIVSFAISLLFNVLYLRSCTKEDVIKESNNNQITGLKPREVTYTTKQFQEYQAKADSTAKANGIKTKYLTKYIYLHDTIHYLDTIANDLGLDLGIGDATDLRVITNSTPCYNLTVLSFTDTSMIDLSPVIDIEIFDFWRHNITPFIKRIWYWDLSKVNEIKAVNRCNGDTINIEKNIQVIKR